MRNGLRESNVRNGRGALSLSLSLFPSYLSSRALSPEAAAGILSSGSQIVGSVGGSDAMMMIMNDDDDGNSNQSRFKTHANYYYYVSTT